VLLEATLSESPLPPETPNTEAIDSFLIRMRKASFT